MSPKFVTHVPTRSKPMYRRPGLALALSLLLLGALSPLRAGDERPAGAALRRVPGPALVSGEVRSYEVRLDTAELVGKRARVYLVFRTELAPNLLGSVPGVAWQFRGPFAGGSALLRERVLVFDGTLESAVTSNIVDAEFLAEPDAVRTAFRVTPRFTAVVEGDGGTREIPLQATDASGQMAGWELAPSAAFANRLRVRPLGDPNLPGSLRAINGGAALQVAAGGRPLFTVQPTGSGVTIQSAFTGKRVVIGPEYSEQNGFSLNAAVASIVGNHAAAGLLVTLGAEKKELLLNAGFQLDARNRFIVTVGQLRQFLDLAFASGVSEAEVRQNTGAISYEYSLGRGLFQNLEVNAYLTDARGADLDDRAFAGGPGFGLMVDPRQVSGGQVTGFQGRVSLAPFAGSTLRLSGGTEQVEYGYLGAKESTRRAVGGVEWSQNLASLLRLNLRADTGAAQNRFSVGLVRSFQDGQIGLDYTGIRGRHGVPNDDVVRLTYTFGFGGGSSPALYAAMAPAQTPEEDRRLASGVLDRLTLRPNFLPMQIIAKIDPTAGPFSQPNQGGGGGASLNTVPNAFGFADAAGVAPGSVVTSAGATIGGLEAASPVSVSGGEYAIDGGAFTSADGFIDDGQTLVLRHTASTSFNATTETTVTVGGIGATFRSTTASADLSPDPFGFVSVAGVPIGTALTSNSVTISGINAPAPISVTGGEYSIDGGGFTAGPGTIDPGQSVAVRHTSAATFATSVTTSLTVGGVTGDFTSTTIGADTDPDAFGFLDQTGVPTGTLITSNTITITGINAPTPISVAGGAYSVDGGGFTGAPGTVLPDQTVAVQHTSAATAGSAVTTTLTVGGESGTFTSTTAAAVAPPVDTTPDAFGFTDQTGVALNTLIFSGSIPITGINAPSPVSVTGGEYSINGRAFTSAPGVILDGEQIEVRHTSAGTNGTATNTTLTIGGVSDTFTSTTAAAAAPPVDTTPDPFSFTDQTGVALGTVVASNAVTVSGINAAAPISVAGGEYSVSGGDFTSAPGTVTAGATVAVRHTSSATPGTDTNTILTIGGVSDTFTSTTIGPDTTPEAFNFTDQTGVALSTVVTSNTITVAGLNTGAPISVTGGEYSVNGGAFTAAAGTVNNGATVAVRHTSSATPGTDTGTTLTIGGVSDTFTSTTVGPDTTPEAFSFTDQTGVALSTLVTSNTITVAGLNTGAPISIAGGEYAVGGGGFTAVAGTVNNGDVVIVRHTSAAAFSTATNTTLTIAGVSDTFTSTTLAADTTPEPFSFTDQTGVGLNAVVTSNTITVAGLNTGAPISVTGGEYSVNGGAFTAAAGTVNNGDTVAVRHTAPGTPGTATNTTLTIGGVSDTFTSVTVGPQTAPNPFSFTDQTGVARSTLLTSNTIVVAGINTGSPISVVGGEYSINGGAFTAAAGTVNSGDQVQVRHTSASAFGTVTDTTLTIGGVSDTFSTTTLAADTTPAGFAFTDQTDVALSTVVTSNTITVSGINTGAPISIAGGEYSINGGAFTAADGTVDDGDTVAVRHTSSATPATATNTTLTIGGVSDTFTSTTVAADTTPDAFSFTNETGVQTNQQRTSEFITITGINAPASISVANGEYQIQGQGGFTSVPGTIGNAQQVRVRHTSAATPGTTVTTTLTIGGVNGTFSSTTASDTTPEAFSFVDQTGVALSALITSDPITVTGIDSPSAITIVGGEYEINGSGTWASGAGTVNANDTVKVRHTSSGSFSTATNTTLTIGGVSDTFTSTTLAEDTTPDVFSFTDQADVALSTVITSTAITVSGINSPATISIVGGTYDKNGDNNFVSTNGTVNNGDQIRVRHTSAAANGTATNTTLTIGGVSDTFTSTTIADTTPEQFTFVDQINVALSTVTTSDPITVSGINAPAAISVTGGTYDINGSGSFVSTAGTVNNGDQIRVRHTSAATTSTATNTTLTIGGVSDTFTSTTEAPDTTPDAFSFTSQTGVNKNATVSSNIVTITGINTTTNVSVTNGQVSINGGAWVTSGTIQNGQTLQARLTAANDWLTTTTANVTVGTVTTGFSVTTRPQP